MSRVGSGPWPGVEGRPQAPGRQARRIASRSIKWSLALVIVVALLASFAPINLASADSGNVLFNGDFEGGWHTTSMSSRVADGWNPWFAIDPNDPSSREPEFGILRDRQGQYHDGLQSQRWFNSYGVHDAGIWEPAQVPVGSYITFSIWVLNSSTTKDKFAQSDTLYRKWVGIDPTGGNYVASPDVVWSPVSLEMDKWVLLSVSTQAKASTVTVFVRGKPFFAVKHNDIIVDGASLVYDMDHTPAPPGAATPPATATPTAPTAPAANAPGVEGNSASFDLTGHSVKGAWLDWFNRHGGIDNNGLPRSEVMQDPLTGQWVQYFQRVVLEWHPEASDAYRIQRRLLGDIIYPGVDAPISPAPAASNSYLFFSANPDQPTGLNHGVSNLASDGTRIGFKDYFDTHGGVNAFGYPKEEPKLRDGRWVQRFQAAVFEYHPENQAPYTVQLELLGDKYIDQNQLGLQ